MIRAHELIGRAVVDMDAAEKLGNVKEIIVNPAGERIAGFVVAHGESIFGGGTHRNVPASALHVIGPDAITISGRAATEGVSELASLPRVSDVIGRKMVSRSGRLLGSISDVLIDQDDGTIIGFSLAQGAKSKLENLFGMEKAGSSSSYVRADADLQVGKELIVVPDDAVVEREPTRSEATGAVSVGEGSPDAAAPRSAPVHRWGGESPPSDRKSVWRAESTSVPISRTPAPVSPTVDPPPRPDPAPPL